MKVITLAPHHEIWQRCRRLHHGGATRAYAKPPSPQYGRTSPVYCEHCTRTSPLNDGEGGGGGGEWGEISEREDPLPKFDLLDEIDLSTGIEES